MIKFGEGFFNRRKGQERTIENLSDLSGKEKAERAAQKWDDPDQETIDNFRQGLELWKQMHKRHGRGDLPGSGSVLGLVERLCNNPADLKGQIEKSI
ncbi:hypothetical protein MYX07_02165 [Patescibacteria group bacterium AH-259-L07]|nr:hypothetical protein [Patescibacteria group bacterium AH-259-L07]